MNTWISVKDRLPEADEEVLVYYHTEYHSFISMCALSIDRTYWWICEDSEGHTLDIDEVTHWMPLPELPKEYKNE